MKRTTVMIPEDLKVRAHKRAGTMGISLGRFIRGAIERALQHPNGDESADDPLFSDDAVFHGQTPPDLAQNHDEYLYRDEM